MFDHHPEIAATFKCLIWVRRGLHALAPKFKNSFTTDRECQGARSSVKSLISLTNWH
jgi:hypothetical protein